MQKKITLNGKEYPFWLNLNSIERIEKATGLSMLKGILSLDTSSIITIAYEGITETKYSITREEVAKEMSLKDVPTITKALIEELGLEEKAGNQATPRTEG
jgi:hypothetical protein